MDKVRDGPDRLAAELGELSRRQLDQCRAILAGPQASSSEARAHFDAQRHEEGVRVAAGPKRDDPIPVLRGEQERRLPATAERLLGRGRRGSPAAAAGRQAR